MSKYYLTTQNNSCKTSYGVTGTDGKITAEYDDVSTDKESLSRLVELCNSLSLELSQLEDILEDFLSFEQ